MPMIAPVQTAVAAFVGWFPDGPMNRAVEVESFADVDRLFGGLHADSEASFGLWQFFRNGGTRSWVVGTGVGEDAVESGMSALNGTDFTLLCLPRIVVNALEYCREKRALLLLDPPANLSDPVELVAWLDANGSLRDDHVAMYYPRVTVADPTREGRPRSVGPSGTIAGLMSATDLAHGVWTAPAGTEAVLQGTARLDHAVSDQDAAALNAAGVNCLRTLPGYGPVCWGARTLIGPGPESAPSPYRYVPVRRLANFIGSSVTAGLAWTASEPNGETLWSAVRHSVEPFMRDLYEQGAFAGTVPGDAYYVRCDATTMTAADRHRGVVSGVVAFAPLRPQEFVTLRFEHRVGSPATDALAADAAQARPSQPAIAARSAD